MTKYDNDRLRAIYAKTDGYCHLCHKKLSLANHGRHGARGGWHVEHSVPRASGGTDHLNNLFAACIDCNLDKSDGSTRAARARNGVSRAPRSKQRKQEKRDSNTFAGLVGGAIAGSAFGPPGAVIGGFLGALAGNSEDVK